jgi:hypothetical protein
VPNEGGGRSPDQEPIGLTDRSLRYALVDTLVMPAVAVLHEVWVPRSHERADVVVVHDSTLTAFEIKSARDRLTRLDRQIPAYEGLFGRCTLVVARRHLPAAEAKLPPWWGVLTTSLDGGALEQVREADDHGNVASDQLVRLLWRDEAICALAVLGVPHDSDATRGSLWHLLMEHADRTQLQQLVAQALRTRNGANARMPARWTAHSGHA